MRALLFTFAFLLGQVSSAEQPAKNDLPKPLPESVVKAWKDAGATVGWMKQEETGNLTFLEKPNKLPTATLVARALLR